MLHLSLTRAWLYSTSPPEPALPPQPSRFVARVRALPLQSASLQLDIKFLVLIGLIPMVGGDVVRAGDGVKSFLQQKHLNSLDFTPPPQTIEGARTKMQ